MLPSARRHYKGKTYEAALLRRSYREDGKVKNETLGNISSLEPGEIEAIRAVLAGRELVDLDEALAIERSAPHGHVAAVFGVLRELDLERLISRERCRERDLVVAMVVQRLIGPGSKLSATRRFSKTTLADELGARRGRGGGAARRDGLAAGAPGTDRRRRSPSAISRARAFMLYDLSSSYVEGRCCSLAALGYSRDGRKGTAAGQLRADLLARGPPGRDLRSRRLDPGPADLAGRGRGGPRALRDLRRGRGRRSRHADQGPRHRAHRRGGRVRQRAEVRPDPSADRVRRSAADAL